jgi:hypothetical protein
MRRSTIFRLVFTTISAPFLVVLYLNIEKWAETKGYDTLLVNALSASSMDDMTIGSTVLEWATRPSTLTTSLVLAGFVLGLWVDALLRRSENKAPRRQRNLRAIGMRCQSLMQEIGGRFRSVNPMTEGDYNHIWSLFLPVAFDLERLRMKVPNREISSEEDLTHIYMYLQFIGPLLQNNDLRAARKAAKALYREVNPDESLWLRWRLALARKIQP